MNIRSGWKIAGMLLGLSSALWAAEVSQTEYVAPAGEAPRRQVTTQTTTRATVEKIDYNKRKITLKEENGEVTEMEVGPEVKRFSEIKKGDVILVDYLESTALYVHKPEKGEKPSYNTDADAVRLEGKMPAAQMGHSERLSAEVVKVDVKNRKLKLKGPDGNISTMNVPKEVRRLNEIKKGDHIVAERTVDVIVAVRKP